MYPRKISTQLIEPFLRYIPMKIFSLFKIVVSEVCRNSLELVNTIFFKKKFFLIKKFFSIEYILN